MFESDDDSHQTLSEGVQLRQRVARHVQGGVAFQHPDASAGAVADVPPETFAFVLIVYHPCVELGVRELAAERLIVNLRFGAVAAGFSLASASSCH